MNSACVEVVCDTKIAMENLVKKIIFRIKVCVSDSLKIH